MPRVFLAIPLDHVTRSAMTSVTIPCKDGLRPIHTDNLHVTLHFLGEVPEPALRILRQTLRHLRAVRFTLRFSGAGRFGGDGRQEILWVGVDQHPKLTELQARIGDCLHSLDMAVEARPYSPHLTIARTRKSSPETAQTFIQANADFHQSMPVVEFCLFASIPSEDGHRYQIIESFPLSAG